MKPDSSKAAIFWFTMAGLTASYVWVETIGLAAASVLGNQTAGGVRPLLGGGRGAEHQRPADLRVIARDRRRQLGSDEVARFKAPVRGRRHAANIDSQGGPSG